MSGGKIIKPWQVMNNIIEWIFMQFTFNILWVNKIIFPNSHSTLYIIIIYAN